MSEKPNIQELVQQINSLSKEEKAELAKHLDLKEMITNLPQRQREDLFHSLNVFWQRQDYEGKKLYENNLRETFQVDSTAKIFTQRIVSYLLECKFHTVEDAKLGNEVMCFLTFEDDSPYYWEYLHYVPIPRFPSNALLDHVDEYTRQIFQLETSELAENISEIVFRGLYVNNPRVKDFITQTQFDLYKERASKGLSKLANNTYRKNTLIKFVKLTNRYEESLKKLKKEFKQIYNSLDYNLKQRDREDKAKQIFIEKYPSLRPEIKEFLGLYFKPKQEAKILAAKDCCLPIVNEQGTPTKHLNNLYTEGKKLLEETKVDNAQEE